MNIATARNGFMLIWFLLQSGCGTGPARVKPVEIHPSRAAAAAIDQYDTNGDDMLSDEELAAVPGMRKWKSLYDTDGDGQVARSEIRERLNLWNRQKLGFRTLRAAVTLDGRPLVGADVRLIPEIYLGPHVKPAAGVTNENGYATLSMAEEDIPDSLKSGSGIVRGVTGGTYRIQVTHPRIDLPGIYQNNSVLGDEIALDTVGSSMEVELQSRPK